MNNIIYPEQFQNPESRNGLKFKFFKVEPYSPPVPPTELPKEIKVGPGSGRIDTILRVKNSDEHINEVFNLFEVDSFDDIINDILLEREQCK